MTDFNLNDMRRMHWSQPVEQQTRDAIAGMTDEQRMLETWLNDDIQCESLHKITGPESCTVEVTHLVTVECKGVRVRVCAVSAATEYEIAARNPIHRHCGGRISECTSVRPI